MQNRNPIDWNEIDTVLLDMDGTLLDDHYEDFFWDKEVPRHYAAKHKISPREANKILQKLYHKQEKNMAWSDIDFWEKELDMKLWDIRHQLKHLVRLHPHTMRFLRFLKKHGKKIYLVTASHPKDIDFKFSHSKIGGYFDDICTSFDFDISKHDRLFWKNLQKKIKYDNDRTLFADDKENIVRVAKSSGIKWVIVKSKRSSKKPANIPKNLMYVHHFDDIIPKSKVK